MHLVDLLLATTPEVVEIGASALPQVGTQAAAREFRVKVRLAGDISALRPGLTCDAEILVAGGVRDLDGLRRLRDTGVSGVILGEALFSGAIEYPAALEAAT
mgnify:CR=1 FL=1